MEILMEHKSGGAERILCQLFLHLLLCSCTDEESLSIGSRFKARAPTSLFFPKAALNSPSAGSSWNGKHFDFHTSVRSAKITLLRSLSWNTAGKFSSSSARSALLPLAGALHALPGVSCSSWLSVRWDPSGAIETSQSQLCAIDDGPWLIPTFSYALSKQEVPPASLDLVSPMARRTTIAISTWMACGTCSFHLPRAKELPGPTTAETIHSQLHCMFFMSYMITNSKDPLSLSALMLSSSSSKKRGLLAVGGRWPGAVVKVNLL
jgi:hypothetical protein